MRRRSSRLILSLFVLATLVLGPLGCANSKSGSMAGYYRRGSIHSDAYPDTYYGGGYGYYGRPGW